MNEQLKQEEAEKEDTRIPLYKLVYKLKGQHLDQRFEYTGNTYQLQESESDFLKGFLQTISDMMDGNKIPMTSASMEEIRSIYYGELLHAVAQGGLSEEFQNIKVNFSFDMRSFSLNMIFLEPEVGKEEVYTKDETT